MVKMDNPALLALPEPLDLVEISLLSLIIPNLQNPDNRVSWDQEDLQEPLDLPAPKVSKVFPESPVNPVKLAL